MHHKAVQPAHLKGQVWSHPEGHHICTKVYVLGQDFYRPEVIMIESSSLKCSAGHAAELSISETLPPLVIPGAPLRGIRPITQSRAALLQKHHRLEMNTLWRRTICVRVYPWVLCFHLIGQLMLHRIISISIIILETGRREGGAHVPSPGCRSFRRAASKVGRVQQLVRLVAVGLAQPPLIQRLHHTVGRRVCDGVHNTARACTCVDSESASISLAWGVQAALGANVARRSTHVSQVMGEGFGLIQKTSHETIMMSGPHNSTRLATSGCASGQPTLLPPTHPHLDERVVVRAPQRVALVNVVHGLLTLSQDLLVGGAWLAAAADAATGARHDLNEVVLGLTRLQYSAVQYSSVWRVGMRAPYMYVYGVHTCVDVQ